MSKKKNTSGGSAMAGGLNFQAAVSAIVSVHVARGTSLGWLGGIKNDIPIEWSAETGGAGDDIQVCFHDNTIAEIQVKKGLKSANNRLWGSLIELAQALHENIIRYGVLVVCPNSSNTIRQNLAFDIIRIGDGRKDNLKETSAKFLLKLKELDLPAEQICQRLRIITIHALDQDSADIRAAFSELDHLCADFSQVSTAWDKIYLDAESLIRYQGRRTPENIYRVFDSANISLKTENNAPISIINKITSWSLNSYKSFQIFGIQQPFSIDNAWIPLSTIVQSEQQITDNKFEQLYENYHSWDERNSSSDDKGINPETIGRFIKHCVVVAGPGMGKSTLLKKLSRVYSKDGFPTLFVRLPSLVARMESGSSFEEAAFVLGLGSSNVSFSEVKQANVKEWVFLFDGLDECANYQETICEELIKLVIGYPNARTIVTTRPIGYSSSILKDDWRHYELLPLEKNSDLTHVEILLCDIYPEESKELKEVCEFAEVQLKKNIGSIVSRNPFLLGLSTSLFLRRTSLGKTKTDLYENLFKLIDEVQPLRTIKSQVSEPILKEFLNIIGWDLLVNPIDDLNSILERCTKLLNKNLEEPSLKARQISENCLKYWEQVGVLEQLHFEGSITITFIHKTFGEFTAARYLVKLDKDYQSQLVETQLMSESSFEVLVFASTLGSEEIVFSNLLNRIRILKDDSKLLIRALSLLGDCENLPNTPISEQILDITFERIQNSKERTSKKIAEAVLELCELYKDEIFLYSSKLLDDKSPWVKLAAWAFLAKTTEDKSVDIDRLIQAFRELPDIEKYKKNKFVYGFDLFGRAGTKLSEVFALFAIRKIIALRPNKADEIIKEVLSQDFRRTTSFEDHISTLLKINNKQDLAKSFVERDYTKWLEDGWWNSDVYKKEQQIAYKKIFTCLNFDNKKIAKISSKKNVLLQLSAFLDASHHEVDNTRHWAYSFDMDVVKEVFKGMLGVSEIEKELFTQDILVVLNDLDNDSFDLYKRTTDVDIQIDWVKAKELVLDSQKIEKALYHHSDWIVQIAANLLINIVDIEELVEVIERVFESGEYTALWAASQMCKEIDRVDLVYKRLKKPLKTGRQYQYLFQVLELEDVVLDSDLLKIISNGLFDGGPITATEASKIAEMVATPTEKKLKNLLVKAYKFWQKNEKPPPKKSGEVPKSPREQILKALFLIKKPELNELLEYCSDVRGDVSDISKKALMEKLCECDEIRNNFLEKINTEEIDVHLLRSAFYHPVLFTKKQNVIFDRLVKHKNPHIRFATIHILDQEQFSKQKRSKWFMNLLHDEEKEIREKVKLINIH